MILVDACTSVLSCTSTLLSPPSHPSADLSPASTLHVTSRSTRIMKQGLQGPIVYMNREPAVCKQSTVPENCCQNPRWKKGVCLRREATTKKIPSLEGFGSRARSGHAGANVAFPTRSATRASAGTRLLLHHCLPFSTAERNKERDAHNGHRFPSPPVLGQCPMATLKRSTARQSHARGNAPL